MFREEIEDLKNRFLTRLALHHVFSREPQDAPISEGRLTREKLAQFFGASDAGAAIRVPLIDAKGIDEVFVCGPYEMNDEAEAALLAAGIGNRIHINASACRVAAPAHPILPATRRSRA
jgi:ring-1,2-phenylacetyl-CoA epoxidase subunit PaaE